MDQSFYEFAASELYCTREVQFQIGQGFRSTGPDSIGSGICDLARMLAANFEGAEEWTVGRIAVRLLAMRSNVWFNSPGSYEMCVDQATSGAVAFVDTMRGIVPVVESEPTVDDVYANDVPIEQIGLTPKALEVLTANSTEKRPLATAKQILAAGDLSGIKGIGKAVYEKIVSAATDALLLANLQTEPQDGKDTGSDESEAG